MNTQRKFRKYLSAAVLIAAFLVTDSWLGGQFIPIGSFVSDAEARVGRPRTPRSVAGVARRTTRRTIRRSAIYVSTLPAGCVRTTVNGVTVSRCGGTYYQPYSGRYVVVYID
jgi:hypothetical protein